jgi:hypothetical protein
MIRGSTFVRSGVVSLIRTSSPLRPGPSSPAHRRVSREEALLQLRQLVEGTDETELVGAEVDGHRVRLRHDDTTEAVRVVGDAILGGVLLDRLGGLEVVEGTAG